MQSAEIMEHHKLHPCTGNKSFCVYLAKDEAVIRRHEEISGFPASKITEARRIIDPTKATEKLR
jgi:hypothetical protein